MFKLDPQLAADTLLLGQLSLCEVLLMNDSQFPWVILVPRREGISEIYQLDQEDQRTLNEESVTLSTLMMQHFGGEKLNIGALGNLVPQLHIHHIVRFAHDPAWPKPVWGVAPPVPYSAAALSDVRESLTQLLSRQCARFTPC